MSFLSVSSTSAKDTFESASTGGSYLLPTGVYSGTLDYIYFTNSQSSKAKQAHVVVTVTNPESNQPQELTFDHWCTYGDTGTPETIKDGKKVIMAGYKQINSASYVATGKPIDQLPLEPKTIKVMNWSTKTKEPINAETIVIGQPIKVGIKLLNKHKQVKQGNSYVPTTDTYKTNEVDRYFSIDGKLATEIATNVEAEYIKKFEEKAGTVFEEKLKVVPIAPPAKNNATAVPVGTNSSVDSLFSD